MLSEETIFSAVACGDRFTAAVTTDGDMYTWGVGERGRLGLGRDVGGSQVGPFSQSRPVFSFWMFPDGFL
jgi:alpha-tubulin suppressor-like RCC1 family protein